MSNSYVGQSGRITSSKDRSLPTREQRTSQSLPISVSHPYQLPPPPDSAPLQCGTPMDLQHRRLPHTRDLDINPNGKNVARLQNNKEQLPSVSQLLTPATSSSLSDSPYLPQFRGSPSPGASSVKQFPITDLHHNSIRPSPYQAEIATRVAPIFPPTLSNGPYGQYHQTPEQLPSISQVGIDSLHIPRSERPSYVSRTLSPPAHGQRPNRELAYSPETHPSRSPSSQEEGTKDTPSGDPQKPLILPQVVDERYIQGEGLCYIYADGSHCPKSIDGEPVNANWGITKAGKPRKRLAQACITCREKKIKCQPNIPKCDQCQKSGRECRFESA
jgi:Fungal Zn(2)-Cys(6) binuclear cluster domain